MAGAQCSVGAVELTRELMRRQRKAAGDHAGASPPPKGKTPPPQKAKPTSAAEAAKAVTVAKPLEAIMKRDMFGRPVQVKNVQRKRKENAGGGRGGAEQEQVRFKYHEGVTNAVRRTVRMQDLL